MTGGMTRAVSGASIRMVTETVLFNYAAPMPGGKTIIAAATSTTDTSDPIGMTIEIIGGETTR